MIDTSVRSQVDTIGYAVTAEQMKRVVDESRKRCEAYSGQDAPATDPGFSGRLSAAVCPHDDYIYAGRLYHTVLPRVQAPRVFLFGVSHKARQYGVADTLVFDDYYRWHSPLGPITVSGLREQIAGKLGPANGCVRRDMHAAEHSMESIAFYLKALNRDVEILPVLVPHMSWDRLNELARSFASALAEISRNNRWVPGENFAIVCSCDAVHYGDVQWGSTGYAPFGTDLAGYKAAVDQDRSIMDETLKGEIAAGKLHDFYSRCTDPDDYMKYRVTWCGRFAVSFGLLTALHVNTKLLKRPLRNVLDDYGTSVSEAHLVLGPSGPSATAPAHFHHFVGYAALGYI